MGIDVDGLATVVAGAADPSVAPGRPAPLGAIYLRTDGTHWRKSGAADTGWTNTTPITVTPAALAAGVTQNYAPAGQPPGTMILRQAVNAAGSALGGLTGGADGRIVYLENLNVVGGETLTLNHLDAGSAAANQFTCPAGAAVVIPDRGCAILMYDGTATTWRVLSVG